MRLFDSITQELKYKVLREVARLAFGDKLEESYYAIPRIIVKDNDDSMRCCIYKDRAIVEEMGRVVVGAPKNPAAILDVMDIACDECPIDKYTVSEGCRGCITHKCVLNCPVGAISIKNKRAVIDQEKCIECGRCYKSCPYTAIREQIRPCVKACKINAIKVNKDRKAIIDHEKCVSCGACMTKCPFGAIQDRSFMVDAIRLIKNSENGQRYNIYAIIAPAIASQFKYAKLGQIVTAIKKLGFNSVVEVALGADAVAYNEAQELAEKGRLLSSCCPAFVSYVEKAFPALVPLISHNVSPMAMTAKMIKKQDPGAKIVFVGPCVAKKYEMTRENIKGLIDSVITFEELQALIDSRDIHAEELEESVIDNASFYGRIFARIGGLSEAVKESLKEAGITDFELKNVIGDGLDQIKIALLKLSKNVLDGNFVEGMACTGGCVNGAGCITHDVKNAMEVDKYGKEAMDRTIKEAIAPYPVD